MTLHRLQHRLPYPYSQIYSIRGLKSIQCWNQCLKYYSSSTFKWRLNLMNFTFLLEIFPRTRYGVRDMASVLLFMVQLEKLHSMHLLQCYITGTWLNSMMSKFTESWCWCHFFCLLWKLCMIIKIFPRRFELYGGFKHLSKTNLIWTSYVLWGY